MSTSSMDLLYGPVIGSDSKKQQPPNYTQRYYFSYEAIITFIRFFLTIRLPRYSDLFTEAMESDDEDESISSSPPVPVSDTVTNSFFCTRSGGRS